MIDYLIDTYVWQLLKQLSNSVRWVRWAKDKSAFPESPVLYRQVLVFTARRRVVNVASDTNGDCIVTCCCTTAECASSKL